MSFSHAACGQATLTIPGTNITIPLGNAMSNVNGQVQLAQQSQAQPQQQQQQSGQQPTNQTQQQQSQSPQANQTTQASQQQQQQQPVTITIPGTNIQISTSVAAANGLITTNNTLKVEGTGKIALCLYTLHFIIQIS